MTSVGAHPELHGRVVQNWLPNAAQLAFCRDGTVEVPVVVSTNHRADAPVFQDHDRPLQQWTLLQITHGWFAVDRMLTITGVPDTNSHGPAHAHAPLLWPTDLPLWNAPQCPRLAEWPRHRPACSTRQLKCQWIFGRQLCRMEGTLSHLSAGIETWRFVVRQAKTGQSLAFQVQDQSPTSDAKVRRSHLAGWVRPGW